MLEDQNQRLEDNFDSDTSQLGRISSVGSNLSDSSDTSQIGDRTFSVGSDTSQMEEKKHTINLEVEISLERSPDYKVNIELRITNKDTINDIKQNILKQISLENLKAEQIIIINSHSREVIKWNNPNLFDLFTNGNISVIVIDKQQDFYQEAWKRKEEVVISAKNLKGERNNNLSFTFNWFKPFINIIIIMYTMKYRIYKDNKIFQIKIYFLKFFFILCIIYIYEDV